MVSVGWSMVLRVVWVEYGVESVGKRGECRPGQSMVWRV